MAKIFDLRHIFVHMARYITGLALDRRHVFAEFQILLVWRHWLETVVAAVADFGLGAFRASRLIDAVVLASRAYALAAAIEEPSVRTCAHTRAVISTARGERKKGLVKVTRTGLEFQGHSPFDHAHAWRHVSHAAIHRHCLKI
jgi:hypothetical protein